MFSRADLKQAARPAGVTALVAVAQAGGGVAALALAFAYADTLRAGGLGIALLLFAAGVLGCGFALLPTHVLSLLCGWAFGLPAGLALALLGATLGAPIGYALGRRLAGPGALQVIEQYPRGAAVCEAITRASPTRSAFLVGLLRLSPVVPYGSTNVLAAVFAVPLLPFLVGTALGLAPRAAAVVALGAGLETLDGDQQASPWMLGAGLAATVLAFVIMGVVAKRALDKAVRDQAAAATTS